MRFDIGRRTSEQQAVDAGQQGVVIDQLAQRRNHQGQRFGPHRHGAHVFVADYVVGMQTDLLGAGRDADDRQAQHGTPVLMLLSGEAEISLVQFITQ